MCLQQDRDGDIVFPYPLQEFIDLTELAEDEVLNVNLNDRNEANWNPYNPLPSSDEDEPELINNDDDNNSVHNTEPGSTDESSNEVNQRQSTNPPITRPLEEIQFEINPPQDSRHFELNIPQILLSMSRISNDLFEQGVPPSP